MRPSPLWYLGRMTTLERPMRWCCFSHRYWALLRREYAPIALARSQFQKTVTACAWPVAGQAGSPPAWMLPDGADWTKAVYTMEVLPLLLAVQRDASPRISSPTSVGLGLDELILGIEPSTLTGQGNSCLALSAKFRLGDSRFLRGRWGPRLLGFT